VATARIWTAAVRYDDISLSPLPSSRPPLSLSVSLVGRWVERSTMRVLPEGVAVEASGVRVRGCKDGVSNVL
jgi:hypothetical protein